MSEQELVELTTKTQKWREEMKVGDMVDVYTVGDEKNKTHGWMQGQINGIEGDDISVIFPKSPSDFDLIISRWSNKIMQFESESKADYEWKSSIEEAKDFILDVHDLYNWEEATIFETRINNSDARPFVEAFVAFRIYSNEGRKEDARGKFNGWTARYDEWIPLYSPRLQHYQC